MKRNALIYAKILLKKTENLNIYKIKFKKDKKMDVTKKSKICKKNT